MDFRKTLNKNKKPKDSVGFGNFYNEFKQKHPGLNSVELLKVSLKRYKKLDDTSKMQYRDMNTVENKSSRDPYEIKWPCCPAKKPAAKKCKCKCCPKKPKPKKCNPCKKVGFPAFPMGATAKAPKKKRGMSDTFLHLDGKDSERDSDDSESEMDHCDEESNMDLSEDGNMNQENAVSSKNSPMDMAFPRRLKRRQLKNRDKQLKRNQVFSDRVEMRRKSNLLGDIKSADQLKLPEELMMTSHQHFSNINKQNFLKKTDVVVAGSTVNMTMALPAGQQKVGLLGVLKNLLRFRSNGQVKTIGTPDHNQMTVPTDALNATPLIENVELSNPMESVSSQQRDDCKQDTQNKEESDEDSDESSEVSTAKTDDISTVEASSSDDDVSMPKTDDISTVEASTSSIENAGPTNALKAQLSKASTLSTISTILTAKSLKPPRGFGSIFGGKTPPRPMQSFNKPFGSIKKLNQPAAPQRKFFREIIHTDYKNDYKQDRRQKSRWNYAISRQSSWHLAKPDDENNKAFNKTIGPAVRPEMPPIKKRKNNGRLELVPAVPPIYDPMNRIPINILRRKN